MVVLEVLRSEKSDAEMTRAFQVHSAAVSSGKQAFLEKDPELLGGSKEVKEYEDRIGQLEGMLAEGVGDRAAQECPFRDLKLDEPIEFVAEQRGNHGFNRWPEALGVSRGTWHHRMREGSKRAERKARDEALPDPVVEAVRERQSCGCRGLRPEVEGVISEDVDGERGDRWIESFRARFKQENASLTCEADSLAGPRPVTPRTERCRTLA
jgi:hypothetical protein